MAGTELLFPSHMDSSRSKEAEQYVERNICVLMVEFHWGPCGECGDNVLQFRMQAMAST